APVGTSPVRGGTWSLPAAFISRTCVMSGNPMELRTSHPLFRTIRTTRPTTALLRRIIIQDSALLCFWSHTRVVPQTSLRVGGCPVAGHPTLGPAPEDRGVLRA